MTMETIDIATQQLGVFYLRGWGASRTMKGHVHYKKGSDCVGTTSHQKLIMMKSF